MSCLFNGQYHLTWDKLYKSDVVILKEHDTCKNHFIKNRWPDKTDFIEADTVSYFDIPREYFEQSNAVIDFTEITKNNMDILVIEVNGLLYRSYVENTNEVKPVDFMEKLREKDKKMKHGNKEESSETIETQTDSGDGFECESCKIDIPEENTEEEYCEACQIHLPEDQI